MTDEEIRIAVAEACGLKFAPAGRIDLSNAWEMWPDHWQDTRTMKRRIDGSIVGLPVALPNYPECLNAMYEAEEMIPPDRIGHYAMHLVRVVGPRVVPAGEDFKLSAMMWHATARQRAEAFLRTLDLWQDELESTPR